MNVAWGLGSVSVGSDSIVTVDEKLNLSEPQEIGVINNDLCDPRLINDLVMNNY